MAGPPSRPARRRLPVFAVVSLGAWAVIAALCALYLDGDRHVLATARLALRPGRPRALMTAWLSSIKLSEVLLAVTVCLALWGIALVVHRRPHPRQWGALMGIAVLVFVGWLFFREGDTPAWAVRKFIRPAGVRDVQWALAAGAVFLIALAYVMIRRAPEPVDPKYDRFKLGEAFTPFNKPDETPRSQSALSEARARAESVLPVDGDDPVD